MSLIVEIIHTLHQENFEGIPLNQLDKEQQMMLIKLAQYDFPSKNCFDFSGMS
jgi:hypothetical protein